MAKSELRVGMISWAHVHAEFRAKALGEIPGARVVAISDDNAERGQGAAKRFGVAKFHKRWQDLIADPEVDVVMVHSENSRHADQVAVRAQHQQCLAPRLAHVELHRVAPSWPSCRGHLIGEAPEASKRKWDRETA